MASDLEEENEADTAREPARKAGDEDGQGEGGGRGGGGGEEEEDGEGGGGGGGGVRGGGEDNVSSKASSKSKEAVILRAVLHRVGFVLGLREHVHNGSV